MNVLIVEDDATAAKTIMLDLQVDKNFKELYWAATKEEAIKILNEKKIDTALLDIRLVKEKDADRQGIEILEYIMSQDKLKHVGCVMNSSIFDMDVAHKAVFELGASDYLLKSDEMERVKFALIKAYKNH